MLPNTIRIGPYTYRIKYVKRLQSDDKDALNGQICLAEGIIKIERALPEDHQHATLMHEVLHGVFYVAGIGAEADHEVGDEELITRISPILYDTLQRNPGIIPMRGGDA